jgi:transposase
MKNIFKCDILEQDNNVIIHFYLSELALERIRHDLLGKTALFTYRSDFSNEEIVVAYRSAWYVERAFRQMKDTKHLTVRPISHGLTKRSRYISSLASWPTGCVACL